MLIHNILVIGPSGSGKSSLLKSALVHYGSGAVAMAPGMDESNSYASLLERPEYAFAGFDDSEFMPELGEWYALGHKRMLTWLKSVWTAVTDDVRAGKPPRYAVIGGDTMTAAARLGYNATLARYKMETPPAAQSPDGAAFYGYMRSLIESQFRLLRAIRGMGVHLIATGHPKEVSKVGEIAKVDVGTNKIMPDIPGGVRDIIPSYFDVVFHAGVSADAKGGRTHYLQWLPDPKRPTKSRLGKLGPNDKIVLPAPPMQWPMVAGLIEKAAEG